MAYKASKAPTGFVNNIKVKCSKCGANLYVNPNSAKAGGGWTCPHCGTRH